MTTSKDLNEGIRLSKECKYAESIEILLSIVKYEPTNINAHLYLAINYDKLQRFKEAIAELLTLTHLEPTNAHYFYSLGKEYERSENDMQAEFAYKKALEIEQNNQKAKDSLSILHSKQHNMAASRFTPAVEQTPKPIAKDITKVAKGNPIIWDLIWGMVIIIPFIVHRQTGFINSLIQSIYAHPSDTTVYFLPGASLVDQITEAALIYALLHYIIGRYQVAKCIAAGEEPQILFRDKAKQTVQSFDPATYNRRFYYIMAAALLLFIVSLGTYARITNSGIYINNYWVTGEQYHSFDDIRSVDGNWTRSTGRRSTHTHITRIVFNNGKEWHCRSIGVNNRNTADAAVHLIRQYKVYQNQQNPALLGLKYY